MNKPQHIQSTHGYVNTKQTETRDGINLVSFLLEIKSRNLLFKCVSGDSQFLIACRKAARGEKFSQIPGPDADVHDVLWIKCSEIRFSKRAKELITRAHSRGKILTLGEPGGNSRV